MNHKQAMCALIVALVLVGVLVQPTIAATDTLSNEEICLSYRNDKVQFRYWYKNINNKHDLEYVAIQEFNSNGLKQHTLDFNSEKVDLFQVTSTSQKLVYDIDEFDGDQRHHVVLTVEIIFNYIEINLYIIRWDFSDTNNHLRLQRIHDSISYVTTVEESYFQRIVVTQAKEGSSFWDIESWYVYFYIRGYELLILMIGVIITGVILMIPLIHKKRKKSYYEKSFSK
ncbi:hypothetical protein [Candidatus Borrarchaeum sp.]|uniref:hypothetical protein n=1 Tax=Candidatus Borrarchaeum sp. TaxID=2846742 RepID=UPI00257AF4AE|nr:hypothetical protein [Candidatus Borrarchaeum sp.]